MFMGFLSILLIDSNSDSDEEETMYMSVHEYYQKQKEKQKKPNSTSLTKFSMNFNITKGTLVVNTPLLVSIHCFKHLIILQHFFFIYINFDYSVLLVFILFYLYPVLVT